MNDHLASLSPKHTHKEEGFCHLLLCVPMLDHGNARFLASLLQTYSRAENSMAQVKNALGTLLRNPGSAWRDEERDVTGKEVCEELTIDNIATCSTSWSCSAKRLPLQVPKYHV